MLFKKQLGNEFKKTKQRIQTIDNKGRKIISFQPTLYTFATIWSKGPITFMFFFPSVPSMIDVFLVLSTTTM